MKTMIIGRVVTYRSFVRDHQSRKFFMYGSLPPRINIANNGKQQQMKISAVVADLNTWYKPEARKSILLMFAGISLNRWHLQNFKLTSLICGFFFFVSADKLRKSFCSDSRNFWAASVPVVPLPTNDIFVVLSLSSISTEIYDKFSLGQSQIISFLFLQIFDLKTFATV